MKRSFKQIITEGAALLWKDIRGLWAAVLILILYFTVGRRLMYSLCPSVYLTGFPCPGCGLTRAMFSIFRGRFADAWELHPFAYFILLFVIIFAVRRYLFLKEVKSLQKYFIVILAGMILLYVYRMVKYFPGKPPMSYYYGSVGYRIWQMMQ